MRNETSLSLLAVPLAVAVAAPAAAAPHAASGRDALAVGLYLGFLMATALLNAVAAAAARRMLHGWFALFVACTGLRWAAVDGLAGAFLPWSDPALTVLIGQVLLGAQMVTGSLCQIWLLELRAHHPFLLRYYLWCGVIPGVVVIAASGSGFFDALTSAMFVALLPAPLLSGPAYLRLWRRGGLAERLIATALPAHFLVMLPATLGNIGLLPLNPAYIEMARLASLPIILALSIGIGLQVRALERERDEARGHAAQAVAVSESERGAREERERLLSMITHEVRTPVAVIEAAAHSLELLERMGGDAAAREARHRSIRHAVERMRSLMALTEADERLRQPPASQPLAGGLDLAGITRNIVDGLDPDAARRVSISGDDPLPAVRGNAHLLYFALLNLLDNAVKYADPDRPIQIEIGADPREGGVVWRIRDHGPGIPPDKRDAVFERYRRLDESSGTPGLGLGLPLSRQIIEQHGGVLRVEAEWPHGACFSAWLPLAGAS